MTSQSPLKQYSRTITLRPANLSDRNMIYDWLVQSDVTSLMLGPPTYPDAPVPTWDQFVNDYADYYFNDALPEKGGCFIIECKDEPVGQVSYNDIYEDGSVELDIWLSSQKQMGKGYGSDAINTLCNYLHDHFRCNAFYLAPSIRNPGAIHAYRKAGFIPADHAPSWFVPDYSDAIVMVKRMSGPER